MAITRPEILSVYHIWGFLPVHSQSPVSPIKDVLYIKAFQKFSKLWQIRGPSVQESDNHSSVYVRPIHAKTGLSGHAFGSWLFVGQCVGRWVVFLGRCVLRLSGSWAKCYRYQQLSQAGNGGIKRHLHRYWDDIIAKAAFSQSPRLS